MTIPGVADSRNPGVSRDLLCGVRLAWGGQVSRRNLSLADSAGGVRRAGDAHRSGAAYRGGMADDGMSPHEARQRATWGIGIALGMGVGVALGSALDNMGLGIALGVAIGAGFAVTFGRTGGPKPDDADAGDDTTDGGDRSPHDA